MIIGLKTDTGLCQLVCKKDERETTHEWQADRTLARDLLAFIRDTLAEYNQTFDDIDGIVVYQGPGSFTGLRIGITVANTLAESLEAPIVGSVSPDWFSEGVGRLSRNENDEIVMPEYGGEANITKPRK